MERDKTSDGNRDEELLVEYSSLRQLNEERLRFLNSRLGEAASSEDCTGNPEPVGSTLANFQASVPETKLESPEASLQKKFSTSWLNMQNYLSERKQQTRNGEQKNR